MADNRVDTANPLNKLKLIGYGAAAIGTALTVASALYSKRPFIESLVDKNFNLVFPRDLEKYSLSMAFDFKKYERRSIFSQPYIKPIGTIRLPVSRNITDKFHAEWGKKSADPVVGAAIENILGAEQGSGEAQQYVEKNSAAGAVTGILEILGGTAAGASIQATEAALSKIPGVSLQLEQILQPMGLAVNPFLTVMFNEPSFKTHSFNWKLIPRDPEEARKINGIINTFKYHMLPDIAKGTGGTLLNYPSMVQIAFFNSDDYLYRFKPCVLTDMRINYAPAATPSFFKGSQNVPTEIDLTLDFMEIEYWTKIDLEKGMIPGVNTATQVG